ncbi:hypothetical protein C8J56DRAFT_914095 [Mycena floridula]|nr:hypothetical protein C8J56DRAFT_914095 [Mycena floridula]
MTDACSYCFCYLFLCSWLPSAGSGPGGERRGWCSCCSKGWSTESIQSEEDLDEMEMRNQESNLFQRGNPAPPGPTTSMSLGKPEGEFQTTSERNSRVKANLGLSGVDPPDEGPEPKGRKR